MSELYNEKGVEFPTRTTAHNQVIPVKIADPSKEVLDNYVSLKNERDMSWDQVADGVDSQDPALADYLRQHGAEHEKASEEDGTYVEPLKERAINPLTTPEERDALQGKAKAAPAKAGAKK